MLRKGIALGLLGAALLECPAAMALSEPISHTDDSSPAELNAVTVQGERTYDSHELEQVIIPQFVRSHSAVTYVGQYARWREPICPITFGLSDAENIAISTHIAEVAKLVDAPAESPCEPNVKIVFTDQPQKTIDSYVSQESAVLGFHFEAQAKRMATIKYPIQAWYVTGLRGNGGNGYLWLDNATGPKPPHVLNSRLTEGVASEFAQIEVIADTNRLAGYDLSTVADYLAMVVLSHPQSLEDCTALPSILDVLSPACGTRAKPQALTAADTAYLKALYSIDLQAIGDQERGELRRIMSRDVEKVLAASNTK